MPSRLGNPRPHARVAASVSGSSHPGLAHKESPWWALPGTTQVLREDGRLVVVESVDPIYNGERCVVLCRVRLHERVELYVLDIDLGCA